MLNPATDQNPEQPHTTIPKEATPDGTTPPMGSVVIVDNDKLSVQLLTHMLHDYDWVAIKGVAYNVADAVALVRNFSPKIVFLDIELNDESGLDAMEEIESITNGETMIVFYTAYTRYMMKAIRMRAFDFLLKPVDADELSLVMERCRLFVQGHIIPLHRPEELHNRFLPDATEQMPSRRSITVSTVANEKIVLSPSNIVYFKYDTSRKIWEAVLNTMQRFMLRRNITADALVALDPRFVRTHKTYIINTSYLAMISGNDCILLPPFDKIKELKISRTYRKNLLDCFYDL